MKAKLIKESINFNRNGSDMDKLDIGMGSFKYIGVFEKSLDLLNIKYSFIKLNSGVLKWDIEDEDIFDTDYVILVPKDVGNEEQYGWHLYREGYEKDPFNIIETLIERKYGNVENKLKSALDKINMANSEYKYLLGIEEKIKELNKIISDHKK